MTTGPSALVLEDELIIGFALEDMLEAIGFEDVRIVTTLEDAFTVLQGQLPDVAVLDVNIHGDRSYEFAKRLSELKVPFVFATGYGDAEHPSELKAVPTVTKPYSLEDIRAAITAAQSSP